MALDQPSPSLRPTRPAAGRPVSAADPATVKSSHSETRVHPRPCTNSLRSLPAAKPPEPWSVLRGFDVLSAGHTVSSWTSLSASWTFPSGAPAASALWAGHGLLSLDMFKA